MPTSGLSPASAEGITAHDSPAPGHSEEGAAAVGQDDQAGPLLVHPPARRARYAAGVREALPSSPEEGPTRCPLMKNW